MRYQHFCINVLQSLHSVSIRDLAAPALTFSRHPASVHTHEHPARKTPQLALGGWNRQEQAYKPRQGHQSFLGGASSFAFGFKILSCEFDVTVPFKGSEERAADVVVKVSPLVSLAVEEFDI